MTIRNLSGCDLWVYAGEAQAPCSLCNVTTTISVPANTQVVINADPNCAPEYWKGFVYSTSPFFPSGSGYAYNPIPIGSCNAGFNTGTNCGSGTINATWVSAGGGGAQQAYIQ
ncbi:MAG: hypothetical protein HKO66_13405 [Saprospiraceae bacterium]|nr:hypothetical protein [Bacteroidia bacterium]NNE15206.1 hypothetical protein [Saprospiraceae bacterium]NNL93231.1 hypothetical protein [Saprospiraceae bacterium]